MTARDDPEELISTGRGTASPLLAEFPIWAQVPPTHAWPEIGQALAAAGRGVAVLTDEPAYGLHALPVVGPEGPLRIRLHAVWNATHYAAGAIREFSEALSAYCAAS